MNEPARLGYTSFVSVPQSTSSSPTRLQVTKGQRFPLHLSTPALGRLCSLQDLLRVCIDKSWLQEGFALELSPDWGKKKEGIPEERKCDALWEDTGMSSLQLQAINPLGKAPSVHGAALQL